MKHKVFLFAAQRVSCVRWLLRAKTLQARHQVKLLESNNNEMNTKLLASWQIKKGRRWFYEELHCSITTAAVNKHAYGMSLCRELLLRRQECRFRNGTLLSNENVSTASDIELTNKLEGSARQVLGKSEMD